MPNHPLYDTLLELAKVHLAVAHDAFANDERIPWHDIQGNVLRERTRVWIDAMKATIQHYEQIERRQS